MHKYYTLKVFTLLVFNNASGPFVLTIMDLPSFYQKNCVLLYSSYKVLSFIFSLVTRLPDT